MGRDVTKLVGRVVTHMFSLQGSLIAGKVILLPCTKLIVMVRLQLHGAIHGPDSFVLMLRCCANLKAIRYESTSLNRIVADKSHRVIVA